MSEGLAKIEGLLRSWVEGYLSLPDWSQLAIATGMQELQTASGSFGVNTFMANWVIPQPKGLPSEVANIVHAIMIEWMKPNIGGVTIQSVNETQSRRVDISDNLIIVQSKENANKIYNTDNSAPHPREWRIQGYINQSIPAVDQNASLKPSLVFQQFLIDAFATSRRPVLYRSGLCPTPTRVLIESYELGRKIEGLQAYEISINLREFVSYSVPIYNYNNPSLDNKQQSGSAGMRMAGQDGKPI
jgi:hypothetical protein